MTGEYGLHIYRFYIYKPKACLYTYCIYRDDNGKDDT